MQTNFSALGESEVAANDLGPLAWVLDELRKSLDGATKALRRFVRDAELARGSDLAELDASQLRIARQQLHQAVGALEMVGLGSPAKMLRAMEALAQKFVLRPEQCSEDAANKVERASFALTEFLEGVLKGRGTSSVALFPQYRDVLELAGGDRVHPADLWAHEWRWTNVPLQPEPAPLHYDPSVRSRLDQSLLKVVRGDAAAAGGMTGTCLGLGAAGRSLEERVFWILGAAFFEAFGQGLLPNDLYVKRTASRVITQYAVLAKGETGVLDRLAQDLLFYCAQAQPRDAAHAPVLSAVRGAYGLAQSTPVDYARPQFGRFDPVVVAQARKRIASATETWAALSGGDVHRLKPAAEQFAAVADSMLRLHPESESLARALTRVMDATVRGGEPPSAPVAMEVATAVLFLDATYEDLHPESAMGERSAKLAERLDQTLQGAPAEPLEGWMEELYRRVSDRQTMGSVVDELRTTLGLVEKSLDQYFRHPQDHLPLHEVPSQLAQMRGVFSVLGLDQASLAALRMRDTVEKFLIDQGNTPQEFERLGNSLGAMGFLIDMLSYQRTLAKKLFVYDEDAGEFRPVMGRAEPPPATPSPAAEIPVTAPPVDAPVEQPVAEEPAPALPEPVAEAPVAEAPPPVVEVSRTAPVSGAAPVAAVPPVPPPPSITAPVDEDDAEMREIFLEEAREVVGNGLRALEALQADPADLGEQTTLRRAFHTLKGSSRMVGLTEFGEAAWAMEQLANTWLAEQKPASADLIDLSGTAMRQFGQWVEDIAALASTPWSAVPFRAAADALRLQNQRMELPPPGAPVTAAPVPASLAEAPAQVPEVETVPPVGAAEQAAEVVADGFADPAVPVAEQVSGEAIDLLPAVVEPLPDMPVEEVDFSATQMVEPMLRSDVPRQDFEATEAFVSVDTPADAAAAAEPMAQQGQPVQLDVAELDFMLSVPAQEGPAPADVLSEEEVSAIDFAMSSLLPAPSRLPDAPSGSFPEVALDLSEPDAGDAPVPVLTAGEPEEAGPATLLPPDLPVVDAQVPEAPADSVIDGPVSEQPGSDDDQIRVIGDLRIGIPLYNVYLNEADEWSRRLGTELSEWELELDGPPHDSTIALAHSLAGSSATVGFKALSEIARSLEFALQHVQRHRVADAGHARTFNLVAEDIRRLLHQFAAGFLKSPDPQLLQALQAIVDTQFEVPEVPEAVQAGLADIELPSFLAAEPEEVSLSSLLPDSTHAADSALALPSVLPSDGNGEAAPEAGPSTLLAPPSVLSTLPIDAGPPTVIDVAAAPLIVQLASEDESDAVDALDADLFPIFEEEAVDLFPQLGGALRQWHARPDNLSARGEALRVLHTLKGSARLAGAMRLGDLAHRLESAVESLGSENLQSAQIDPLLGRFDTLQQTFDALRALTQDAHRPVESVQTPSADATAPAAPAEQDAPADPATAAGDAMAAQAPETLDRRARHRSASALGSSRQGGGQTVRVSASLLDRLVNQSGEVIITRSRLDGRLGQLRGSLKELSTNLDRLRQQLREIELQSESQMQSRLAQAKDLAQNFDPLEFDRFTRVQELTRIMAETVNDVATVHRNLQRSTEGAEDDLIAQARQARELQRDLLRTRMVEFEGISERLYAVVRQAGKDTGKQVKLDIVGGSMDLDRSVLERMAPAFEHLLRNAVAHGIESVEARQLAGKAPTGSITITLQQEGNDVSVQFSDDGAGLDLPRIRAKAEARGLVAPGAALGEDEVASLIFQPGFSTAEQVTELAGRGVGLDVVRAEVNAFGGRIETHGVPGQGTTFKLVVPLTTAVTQVVMLRMGELSIGVPSSLVEIVRRVPQAEVAQAYADGHFRHAEEDVPFHWAGALLQSSPASREAGSGKHVAVVVFRSVGRRVALHVDEVLGNQEVVVKNLGPQLVRVPGLTGMSVLASGAVVLIYNPVALVTIYGEQARRLHETAGQAQADQAGDASGTAAPQAVEAAAPQVPLVLVVDDSITVRRVTQRLLKREGYRVALANDGLQALERLREELPAVVLSDIEMPRMDGFDLARNIRGDERTRHLPIIMITSRIAEKHREHARELGVDHYLGKPYSEEELLGLIRHFCAVPEDAAAPA